MKMLLIQILWSSEEFEGKRFAARFNIDEVRSGQAEDPVLREGDVVVVSTSQIKNALNSFLKILPAATLFAPLL